MTSHAAAVGDGGQERLERGFEFYNLKLGMWIFLLSEVMFFTSLIGAYIILRFAHPEQFPAPGTVLSIELTAFNTFMLICSSVTMVKAYAAVQHDDQQGLQVWLLATIILGASFVGIQMYEYVYLVREGFVPIANLYTAEGGPLYGSTFYLMTGFHGTHVTIGVLALTGVLLRARTGAFNSQKLGPVEIVGLYWHFVDLVWIVLFTIVYLI
ncbi:MAG: heme-copper oxidase subunit III [Gemmatimonadetes bacterium]|nr:heme-copper oxidase subunit III [Gemmatimonadota bacterium]